MTGQNERSTLDEAWAAWIDRSTEDAIRRCTGILEADPDQLGAARLLATALCEVGLKNEARAAAERLVDANVRRGNLPAAVASAKLAAKAGGDEAKWMEQVAQAFAAGSPRLADIAPMPPPLPPPSIDLAPLAKLGNKALHKRAAKALARYVATLDPLPEDGPVPALPLFSKLPPQALRPLLEAFTLREFASAERAVEEGTEGREAFVVVRGHLRVVRGRGDHEAVLAMLGPGALFGEMALVSDAPRAASVVAEEPVQLLAASRGSLEQMAKDTPMIAEQLAAFCRNRMVANLMRHSPLLAELEHDARKQLMKRLETRSFRSGEKLVRIGEDSEGLFLIASGAVRVIGRDADGEELQIAQLGPGDVVGEISLVLRRPATASVVATHHTVALALKRDQFQDAIREHPTLLRELYDLATKREEEIRTVVGQEALNVEEVVLL